MSARLPGWRANAAADAAPIVTDRVQEYPAVSHEVPNTRMLGEHGVDGGLGRGDEHVEPNRLMHEACSIVHRLPGQSHSQVAGVAFEHTELSDDVVQDFIAGRPAPEDGPEASMKPSAIALA